MQAVRKPGVAQVHCPEHLGAKTLQATSVPLAVSSSLFLDAVLVLNKSVHLIWWPCTRYLRSPDG
jgi:hypothetical protein